MAPIASWKLFCSKWVIQHCYGRDVQTDTSKCLKITNFKRKNQKLITDIGGGWYLKKYEKGLPPLKRAKLSKNAQDRHDLIKKPLWI